jgi:hypothetical protein
MGKRLPKHDIRKFLANSSCASIPSSAQFDRTLQLGEVGINLARFLNHPLSTFFNLPHALASKAKLAPHFFKRGHIVCKQTGTLQCYFGGPSIELRRQETTRCFYKIHASFRHCGRIEQ